LPNKAGRLPLRGDSHDIDTLAKRQLAGVLPANWEARELTGHDYGIDLVVELFLKDKPRGQILQLQIKGQDRDWPDEHEPTYQFPVRTLLYAELFAVPVLAALVPVKQPEPVFAFLWLQEYVAVRLDPEHATWRDQETVAIHFPLDNLVPPATDRLEWIAGHLDRQRAHARLSWVVHELRYAAEAFDFAAQGSSERTLQLLTEARELLTACGSTLDQDLIDWTISDIGALQTPHGRAGLAARVILPELSNMNGDPGDGILRSLVAAKIRQIAQALSATVAQFSDAGMRRSLWLHEHWHWY
jgi:Domain of unknown function (DUF4365)